VSWEPRAEHAKYCCIKRTGNLISTRNLIRFLCVLLPLMAVPLLAQDQQLPDDIKAIKERGKLIVSQYRGFSPPFFYPVSKNRETSLPSINDHGRTIVGRDIYLAKSLAKILDVELEVRRTASSYDEVCQEVADGRADIGISGLTATPHRSMFVRFSEPYAEFKYIIILNRLLLAQHYGADTITPANLIERLDKPEVSFSSVKGTAMARIIKGYFPRAELRLIPETAQPYDDVIEGRVWAALANFLDLELVSRQKPQAGLYVLPVVFKDKTDKIAIAIAPNKPNLLSFINTTLSTHRLYKNVDDFLADYYPDITSLPVTGKKGGEGDLQSGHPIDLTVWASVITTSVVLTFFWWMLARWGRKRL
jgi:ABC-type amino acid transport substrate-binding protein